MKNIIKTLLLLLSITTAHRSSAQPYNFAPLTQLLQDSLSRVGGGITLLLIKDNQVIYRESLGNIGSDSIVEVASATKWLSGAVILKLVDQGKLSLDDSIGKFLPQFTGGKARITVRQLFSHTSGLKRESTAIENGNITLAEAVDSLALLDLEDPPGTVFNYGGVSMHIAGRIAEIASGLNLPSGQCWDTLFANLIAKPLGMTACDYETVGDSFQVTENPRIAGGVRCRIDDFGKFLKMILNQGRTPNGDTILSESMIAEMLKDQTNNATIENSPYRVLSIFYNLPALTSIRYGIGVWRESVDAQTGELLEGASQGAFGYSPWIDLKRNLAGVMAVKKINRDTYGTYLGIKSLVKSIVPISTVSVKQISTQKQNQFNLEQNYPNPFNPTTTIQYQLSSASEVRLELFDLLGRKVAQLVNARQEAGAYSLNLNAAALNLASGVYFYRLRAGEFVEMKKMMLMK